jgi:putative sigma-54 modulation protein
MQITTTVRHFELDPEDRLFANQRLDKLGRYARDIREVHLIVTAEKNRLSAEITARLKHHDLASREESTAARTAIELAAAHMEEQLRRLKEKRVDRKHRPRANGVPGEQPAGGDESAYDGQADDVGAYGAEPAAGEE